MLSYKKNIIFQYGLEFARYFFPFIVIPFLTRTLGADVYAVRAYILAVMTFVQVFLLFGFNSYGTREVALHDDLDTLCKLTSNIIVVRLFLCFVAAVILAVATLFIPLLRSNPVYVLIAFIGVCFKCSLPDFIFQGKEDMGIITKRFVVSQIVSTILIITFVRSSHDLLLIPFFEGCASFIAFAWSWYTVAKKYKIRVVMISVKGAFSVFRQSFIYFVSNASTTIFSSLTTILIGILISDPAEISYWSIAMTAITAVQALYSPITNSIYPYICKTEDFKLVKKVLAVCSPIVLIGTVIYAFLADIIMLILGGQEFIDGSYVVVFSAPVLFFSFYAMVLGFPILAAVGKIKQLTLSSIVSALFHIAGLLVLAVLGEFTIVHVAILRCTTEALLAVMRVGFASKYLQVRKA